MYTRFYDDTIITRFIKYLLANTYTPLVRVWNPGTFTIAGAFYIHNGNILQAKYTKEVDSVSDFDIKKIYVPSLPYYGINSTYVSNVSGYDPVTHRWLGNHLRFIRDYYNVNLMPFYNCFCGEFVSNVDIRDVTNTESNSTYKTVVSGVSDERSKVFVVPVKFGQIYNLAVDSNTPIEFMYGFYGPKGLIEDATDTLRSQMNQTHYTKIPGCQFTSPYIVPAVSWGGFDEATRMASQYERYLRLFVKVPSTLESSIAVIEGDISRYNTLNAISDDIAKESFTSTSNVYTNILNTCNSKTSEGYQIPRSELFFNYRTEYKSEDDTNAYQTFTTRPIEDCLGPLGLLQWSDGNIYAFSDRLVEYLLWNVVDALEPLYKNIERTQERITSLEMSNANLFPRYRGAFTSGVWDENMQKYIYALRKSVLKSPKGNPSVDFNGFVDKDTESILNRGRK